MDWRAIRIGTVHCRVGESDGVSIVIDQIVAALHEYLGVPRDNFYFACGDAPGHRRERLFIHEALSNRSATTRYLLRHWGEPAPGDLAERIEASVADASGWLARFVRDHRIDLLLAHNTAHPDNLVAALALHRLFEQYRAAGRQRPIHALWWHDSHLERQRYRHPNGVVRRYIEQGLPGPHVDRIIFINRGQWPVARTYFERFADPHPELVARLERGHTVVPNTCAIPRNWIAEPDPRFCAPKLDEYNRDFLSELGIEATLAALGKRVSDALLLLQHTRVVPRKRIDHAIDFAFAMADRLAEHGHHRVVFLVVSGSAGDELGDEVAALERHFARCQQQRPDLEVHLLWAGARIRPRRETQDGVKYYAFAEVPEIVAYYGGLGTFFSELEGFGNNLLELISCGVPPVVRRYPVFDSDLAGYGFEIPSTADGRMTQQLLAAAVRLVVDVDHRKTVVRHNLQLLREHLSHERIAHQLAELFA